MAVINMFIYWGEHADEFLTGLLQHLALTGLTLVFSIILAAVLTLLIWQHERLANVVVQIFGAVYAIPSLALFAILIPVMGIGTPIAVFVLTLYNQFLLLRNIVTGLDGVDPAVTEAAVGMGMTPFQVLTRVKLPLALPSIIAGLRLAIISTIGIATIASVVGAGGLGTLLFQGLRTENMYKLIGATLLCFVVAWVINRVLQSAENRLTASFSPQE